MTDPMSPEELRACRERAEAATPGPWEVRRADDVMGGFDYFVEAGPMTVAVASEDTRPHAGMGAKRDAAFIAHARTDVPRLLATVDAERETIAARDEEIARLRAEVAELRESINQACVTPADDCDCEGCRYAAEVNGRGAEEEDGDD